MTETVPSLLANSVPYSHAWLYVPRLICIHKRRAKRCAGLEVFVLFPSLHPIHPHKDLPRHLDEGHEHLAGEEVEGQRGERVPGPLVDSSLHRSVCPPGQGLGRPSLCESGISASELLHHFFPQA